MNSEPEPFARSTRCPSGVRRHVPAWDSIATGNGEPRRRGTRRGGLVSPAVIRGEVGPTGLAAAFFSAVARGFYPYATSAHAFPRA